MKDDVGDFEHRRVVLCVTKDSTTWFVLVNLTTVYPGKDYDDTCVLEPGVEKYITKRCYAYYALCEPISKEDVLERIKKRLKRSGRPGFLDRLKPTTFWQIYDGALNSPSTQDDVKEILTKNRDSIVSYIQELEQD